jgi:hypothetical protein
MEPFLAGMGHAGSVHPVNGVMADADIHFLVAHNDTFPPYISWL